MPDAADEGRHVPSAELWWHETYEFRFWLPDGSAGGTTSLTFLPAQRRAWFWAVLVRAGHPLLHVAQLDAPCPPAGLVLKAHGVWADHVCEAPFEQWTVMNETYAVALDDPDEALGRMYGVQAPIAFDLEWYAVGAATWLDADTPGAADAGGSSLSGYHQRGEVHGLVELAGGALPLDGVPADRTHTWGVVDRVGEARRAAPARPGHEGLAAPVAIDGPDGRRAALQQVLLPDGAGWATWWEPLG